jgi:hypothetical protein
MESKNKEQKKETSTFEHFNKISEKKPLTFEELNKQIIEKKGFLLELTNEERAEAIRLGFKINSSKDVLKFKKWYESQQKLSFWQRVKVCINYIFNDTISEKLEFVVLKRYIKKQKDSKIKGTNTISTIDLFAPNTEMIDESIANTVSIEEVLKELELKNKKTLEQRLKEAELLKSKTNNPTITYTVYVKDDLNNLEIRFLTHKFQALAFKKQFKGNVPTIKEYDKWLEKLSKQPEPNLQNLRKTQQKTTKQQKKE